MDELPLSDRELQSLRNLGCEFERAADEIERLRAYAAAAVAMEREKWESLCRAQGFLYMIEKRAKMK